MSSARSLSADVGASAAPHLLADALRSFVEPDRHVSMDRSPVVIRVTIRKVLLIVLSLRLRVLLGGPQRRIGLHDQLETSLARAPAEICQGPAKIHPTIVAFTHQAWLGQVVAAQDVLFQIVDPNSLWIEAYDYGENDPAALEHATAIGGGNVAMKLSFQGWSRALQQQATVLHFAITDPTASLRVGQPVTVTAQRGGTTIGVIIDRDAIVRGGNGESVVWRHVEPEYFEARPVRTEPFDATHVLVAVGIDDGERIVIRGAELINQVR